MEGSSPPIHVIPKIDPSNFYVIVHYKIFLFRLFLFGSVGVCFGIFRHVIIFRVYSLVLRELLKLCEEWQTISRNVSTTPYR